MSELLTRADYAAIADGLTLPRTAFIDGAFRPAASGATFETRNPATGETLAEVAACGAEEVDFAVAKAREAFEEGRWARLHPAERKRILVHFAKLIERNRHELAVMESLDSGKPIRDCVAIDLPETANCIKWHAEAIDKIYDQSGAGGRRCAGDHRARADRRGRPGAALELSAVDDGLEDRPGLGCRLFGHR